MNSLAPFPKYIHQSLNEKETKGAKKYNNSFPYNNEVMTIISH